MKIYLQTLTEKAIGGYESDIAPRAGEFTTIDGKELKVLLVSHRVRKNLVEEYKLQVVDVTVSKQR